MKKVLISSTIVLFSAALCAQVPEDVLKYSWNPTSGTARIAAIGGAMGSLGGDISSTFINPAGIAFYKTSDFVLSPGLSFLKNKSNFRGTKSTGKEENYSAAD